MDGFTGISVSLFLTLMLQFTVTGQFYFIVRDGDDVTLPCGNVKHDQEKCDKTTWTFSGSTNTAAVELVQLGQIHKDAKSKSDRLSVTEKCSLDIKKVTEEDVGRYICRQFEKEGRQLGSDSEVDLSVVTRTEHKDDDKVTLTCSVWTHGHCGHTVKWLYDHNNNEFTVTEQKLCDVSVTLTTSELHQKYSDLLTCEVTDGFSRNVQQFTFTRPSSGETSDLATPRKSTMNMTLAAPVNMSTGGNGSDPPQQLGWFWLHVLAAVGSAALVIIIITVVVVIRWRKIKGETNKTDAYENMAAPTEGVYVKYIKKSKSPAQSQKSDAGKRDEVTYRPGKAHFSSFGVSDDPDAVYASIN